VIAPAKSTLCFTLQLSQIHQSEAARLRERSSAHKTPSLFPYTRIHVFSLRKGGFTTLR
jgi:hypothetical protein